MKNGVLHLGALSILFVLPAVSSARMKSVESNKANRIQSEKPIAERARTATQKAEGILTVTKKDTISRAELQNAVAVVAQKASLSASTAKQLASANSPIVRQEILELAEVAGSVKSKDLAREARFLIAIKDVQSNNAPNSVENAVLGMGKNSAESLGWKDAVAVANAANVKNSVSESSSATLGQRVSEGVAGMIGANATAKEVRQKLEDINRECR